MLPVRLGSCPSEHMPDPFRQPAATPTTLALAKLDAMSVNPIRFLCALLVAYREIPSADANGSWRDAAFKKRMAYLGAAVEGLSSHHEKQLFVDEPGTTQAHVSISHYFFATYFESGRCVLTYSTQVSATHGHDDLKMISGVGGFESDYETHAAAVAEWVDAGEVTIVVRDIQSAVALGRYFYRQLIAKKSAVKIIVTDPIFIAIVLFLLIISRFF
jgi:hypothetical protein